MKFSHPIAAFGKTRIINLAARADRRAEMQEQLQREGLSLDAPPIEIFEAVRPSDAGGFPSLGARGCFLSHLGVIEEALAEGLSSVLILEDDLNFATGFTQRLAVVVDELNRRPWDLFYGGYVVDGAALGGASGLVAVSSQVPVGTTHFVAINGHNLRPLASYLRAMLERQPGDPAGGPMHVDGAYSWYRQAHPHAVTLLASPELGYQRASRTDIHELGWHDRTPVIRELAAFYRRLKNG